MENSNRIPTHVAIIMDGNGRWAKSLGKERYEGHIEGVDSVRECIKAARRNGVKYLTLYAFSTENWSRPEAEVEAFWDFLYEPLRTMERYQEIGNLYELKGLKKKNTSVKPQLRNIFRI